MGIPVQAHRIRLRLKQIKSPFSKQGIVNTCKRSQD